MNSYKRLQIVLQDFFEQTEIMSTFAKQNFRVGGWTLPTAPPPPPSPVYIATDSCGFGNDESGLI